MNLPQRLIDGAKDALQLAQGDADAMTGYPADKRRQSRLYDGIALLERLLNEAIETERKRIHGKGPK